MNKKINLRDIKILETSEYIKNQAEIISEKLFNPRKCILCRRNFAITSNLPRILPQCGHSLCSICTAQFIEKKNFFLKCPFCLKKIKNIKNSEDLPVNQKIFYYLQKNNKDKKKVNKIVRCLKHPDKVQQFICRIHKGIFCENCLRIHQSVEGDCRIFNIRDIKGDRIQEVE